MTQTLKNAISPELLRFQDRKIISYDFETCNLCLSDPQVNKPWQIGWTCWEGKRRIFGREDWLLWDPLPMGRDAARITGFEWPTYHARAKDSVPVYEEFEKYLYDDDYLLIGANLFGFDIFIIGLWQRLLGRKVDYSFLDRTLCVQNIHKAQVLGIELPKIQTAEWTATNLKLNKYHDRKLKTNLKFLSGEYGVDYDESMHHVSAEWDCDQVKMIFDKMLYRYSI